MSVAYEKDGDGGTEFRVVQLSDLEISPDYTPDELPDIVERVNKLEPDVIVFTGDLFSNYAQYHPTEQVQQALADLKAEKGKFAVWGNNDYGGGAAQDYPKIMEKAGFQLLCNSGTTVSTDGGRTLYIAGLDEKTFGEPNVEAIARNDVGEHNYHLLLAHEPSLARLASAYAPDLILAGHTHGGQIALPFADKLGFGDGSDYLRGMYELNNKEKTKLFVHNGMGTSRIPVRFLVPPQIAVFDIKV